MIIQPCKVTVRKDLDTVRVFENTRAKVTESGTLLLLVDGGRSVYGLAPCSWRSFHQEPMEGED